MQILIIHGKDATFTGMLIRGSIEELKMEAGLPNSQISWLWEIICKYVMMMWYMTKQRLKLDKDMLKMNKLSKDDKFIKQ